MPTPRLRPLTRVLALVPLAVASAACGARWTDEQAAEVADRRAATEEAAPGDTSTVGPVDPSVGEVSGPDAAAVSSGGTAGAVPAAAGARGGGAGVAPCTAPSDAPGVTDRQITVGAISSLSGPVPGLGASSAAATRAYVAFRNATGGVCGRQVVLREADDGTDNGRYRSVVDSLAPQVLGLAGGFALGDVGGVDVVRATALPVVNIPSGEAASELSTVFDVNPPFDDLGAVVGKYRYLREQGATKAALAYLAVDQSRAEAALQRRLMEAAGIEVVQVQELPIATLSYDSPARRVANSGADYLFFIADAHGNAAMASAMADTGHRLRVAEYFTFAYGTPFAELAGTAAEGATTWLRTLPNEEAGTNAEMAAFLEWMERVAPDDVTDVFAADSWAAAKAFFDALEAVPGPITRAALVAQLQSVETYDAGGMLGPIRLGVERTNGCVVGMRVEDGRWRRMAPGTGFLC